jgi:hypothetical protein
MAKFSEVFSNSGVDENVTPTGMIVPVRGSNIVRLDNGQDLEVIPAADSKLITIKKLSSAAVGAAQIVGRTLRTMTGYALLSPKIRDERKAELASALVGSPRFFEIFGHLPGVVTVNATNPRTKKPETSLQVLVLEKTLHKLSVRQVQVSDGHGGWVNHHKKPFNAAALQAEMNSIWTPQANVAFDLVSSTPVKIDDTLPPVVAFLRFAELFDKKKDSEHAEHADITMFLVEQVGDDGGNLATSSITKVDGITVAKLGVSLISDPNSYDASRGWVMAHEAGHFLGFGHRYNKPVLLMQDGGGADVKISMAGLHVPLPTLRRHPRGCLRTARGRLGFAIPSS